MLRVYGVVSSPWLSMVLAGALSLAASFAGAWYWRRRRGGGPLLFSDLLIWGWLRRWRQERKLADAINALGLEHPNGGRPEQGLSGARAERVLSQLVDALESQDVYLRGHSRRVARHAGMIAQRMRLPAEEVDRVRAAAMVHDVGKLRTPWQIVDKPSRLTDAEFELIKPHSLLGAEMAAALGDPGLTAIVRHHHERVDGTGYPDGLRGDQIPLGARIIAVADTFDALTSTRPYRSAARHQRAIEILRQASGSQLDPTAVRAFLAYYSGHRLAVAWATACATPRRIIGWFNGDALAAPVTSGKLATAVVMSAALASSAAVAPIAAVHVSGLLTAAPGISANPGDSTSGPHATLSARRRDGKHRETSRPARGPAAAFASANTPTTHPRAVLVGGPIAGQRTIHADRSPTAGPGTTSALVAATSIGVPPAPTPTGTTAPSAQASSTASAPIAQTPVTTAPPSRTRGHAGTGSGSPSRGATGRADARGPANAVPTGPSDPSGGPPGHAYGQGNGGPGNPSVQGNPGDQGNRGGQGDAGGQANSSGQGNATGQANASGHGNAAPPSAGAQGAAYGHTHAGS